MSKLINIIINNAIRITRNDHTLTDGGNILPNDLAKMGINVRLVGLCQVLEDNNINSFLSKDVQLSKLTFNFNHNNSIVKILNYFYAFFKLIRISFTGKYYYIYLPSNISLITLFFLMIFRKKYGLYIRGNIQQSRFAGKVRNSILMKKFYYMAVKKASFVMVTGKSLETSLNRLNKNTELVIPMIPFNDNDLYKRNSIHKDHYEILFVGRLDSEKGVEELIESIPLLLKKTKVSFKLILIGGGVGSYINFLNQKIQKLQIENFIELRGRISDINLLKEFYLKADIFVLPSHHEGFPRVLYEAMTFSLPIITTNLETYEGIMEDEKNCLMVSINNPKQLSDRIIELLDSQAKRSEIALAGYEYMKSFYKEIGSKTHAIQVIRQFEKLKH